MSIGYFGKCDGPNCEGRKEEKEEKEENETAPAGWASVKVEVQRCGLPLPNKYVFHSRQCFLDWAAKEC